MRVVLEGIMSNILKTLLLIFGIPLIVWAQKAPISPLALEGQVPPGVTVRTQSPIRAFPPVLPVRPAPPVLPVISAISEVDVTTFGAIGDSRTDDTVAIQNALAAACSPPGLAGTGERADLVFPPGIYLVTQTQAPSTAPIFTSCSGLRFLGLGGSVGGAQFTSSPQARIDVRPGSSPNRAPVISAPYGTGNGVTIENLVITGYNQAVFVGGAVVHLKNDCFIAATTGMPDNAALEIADTLWVWFEGGCLQTYSPSVPGVEIVNDNVAAATGIIEIENVIAVTGAFQVNVRQPTAGGVLGNLDFRNVTVESGATDFLTVNNTSGVWLELQFLRFQNAQLADSAPGSFALLQYNEGVGGRLQHVHIVDSGGSGGGPDIRMSPLDRPYDASITDCFACVVYGDGTVIKSVDANYFSDIVTGEEGTSTNCQSSTSPAACGEAQAGMVAVPAGGKTLFVNDADVTANSEIHLTFDSSISGALGVTCNTEISQPSIGGRVPLNGFTISMSEAATPNPDCITFRIVN
jgi:Pectate lyase superfamily protein